MAIRARQLCPFLISIRRSVRRVIVDLYPVAVRILEIDLFDTVYPYRWFLRSAGPVFVWYAVLIEIINKIIDRFHTEAQMIVFITLDVFLGALYEMQLPCRSQRKPGMPAILKRFFNFLQHEHIFVK